jgi:hypothetical protein
LQSRARARHVRTADEFEAAFAEAPDHLAGKRGLAFIEVAIARS